MQRSSRATYSTCGFRADLPQQADSTRHNFLRPSIHVHTYMHLYIGSTPLHSSTCISRIPDSNSATRRFIYILGPAWFHFVSFRLVWSSLVLTIALIWRQCTCSARIYACGDKCKSVPTRTYQDDGGAVGLMMMMIIHIVPTVYPRRVYDASIFFPSLPHTSPKRTPASQVCRSQTTPDPSAHE